MGNQLKKEGALLAIGLKSLDSRKDPIVHRVHNVLLTTEVFFRGLDPAVYSIKGKSTSNEYKNEKKGSRKIELDNRHCRNQSRA